MKPEYKLVGSLSVITHTHILCSCKDLIKLSYGRKDFYKHLKIRIGDCNVVFILSVVNKIIPTSCSSMKINTQKSREQNDSLTNTDQRSSNKERQRKGKSCKQSGRLLFAGTYTLGRWTLLFCRPMMN